MWAQSVLLIGIILDLCNLGDSMYTAEVSIPGALALYVLFIIVFFAINQSIIPALLGDSCWQSTQSKVKQIHKVGSYRND